ncbi:MAG: hypothetical protein JWM38_1100 [Sphingomonas bacterium]|jgi:hypothetical protein|nr:hypothetical protein [Sphingomonas bacterium]MDB5717673.1 hypothetical protein [Sphingomonas bacterium]
MKVPQMKARMHKRAFARVVTMMTASAIVAMGVPAGATEGSAIEGSEGFVTAPVTEEVLKAVAGREDVTQIAQAQQAATVTRNSVGDNVKTGEVRISDQAFQHLSGLSLLNVNTGNNVAINASMNVNISLVPAP